MTLPLPGLSDLWLLYLEKNTMFVTKKLELGPWLLNKRTFESFAEATSGATSNKTDKQQFSNNTKS